MHIFLIDDNSTSVFLTERLLKRDAKGYQISCFLSAQEALERLQHSASADVPRIILLDLNMPVMNGWEFLEALKPQEHSLLGRCHIYILTSSLAPSDASKSKEYALVVGLIPKPIDKAAIELIRKQTETNFHT